MLIISFQNISFCQIHEENIVTDNKFKKNKNHNVSRNVSLVQGQRRVLVERPP